VPIIEKNAWEIAVHGERKEKKRTIMHVYKIQDISSFFLHIYMPQSTNEKKKLKILKSKYPKPQTTKVFLMSNS